MAGMRLSHTGGLVVGGSVLASSSLHGLLRPGDALPEVRAICSEKY